MKGGGIRVRVQVVVTECVFGPIIGMFFFCIVTELSLLVSASVFFACNAAFIIVRSHGYNSPS